MTSNARCDVGTQRNRESARLSRRRRKQYLEILEDRVTQLSTEVDQGRRAHAAQAVTITLHKRREIMEGQGNPLLIPEHGSLRGSKEASSSSGSQLILHLALDTPAQVWSLAVEEGDTRGSLVLPSCAVSLHPTDDAVSKDDSP